MLRTEQLSASVDFPMSLYWRDLARLYPRAKVVLYCTVYCCALYCQGGADGAGPGEVAPLRQDDHQGGPAAAALLLAGAAPPAAYGSARWSL